MHQQHVELLLVRVLYSQSRTTNPSPGTTQVRIRVRVVQNQTTYSTGIGVWALGAYGQRRKRKDSFLISIIYVPYLVNSAIIQNYWHNIGISEGEM